MSNANNPLALLNVYSKPLQLLEAYIIFLLFTQLQNLYQLAKTQKHMKLKNKCLRVEHAVAHFTPHAHYQ